LQIADTDRPLLAYGHTTWHTALLGCAARPIQPRVLSTSRSRGASATGRAGHVSRWSGIAGL